MTDARQRYSRWRAAWWWSGGIAATVALAAASAAFAAPTGWKIVGWNNLGMHCMDADFSVFATLPPYNTIEAHVIDPSGNLVTSPAGITVTYQAVADSQGSINTTSLGKTNFWQNVQALFGASPAPDTGLVGARMPGAANTPRPMTFDATRNWFIAEGIPLTPYDDAHVKNYYPMMRMVVRDATNAVLATTDIVLPVSDEMDCRACHASGSGGAARPSAGWVNDPDPQRDFRRNILLLHDEMQSGDPVFTGALGTAGYSSAGLSATATGGKAVLCARCHLSEALSGSGLAGILPLTAAMHGRHANVTDPTNGMTLEMAANRSACYRCHPGSETRCLRSPMGNAVAANGTMAIQCQDCHGQMSAVGAPSRTGWLDEPSCQMCHTGTATHNNGQIRYTSAFDSSGSVRQAIDTTFATNANTPLPGTSLYRYSSGHGGLQCEACHGSTHAELPTSTANDNVQSSAMQGHKGTIAECTGCHTTVPSTTNGGPHGMHPVGQAWVSRHHDVAEGSGASQCTTCHGADYRGTVLSRAFAARAITSEAGSLQLWRGFQVGCYGCHQGPSNDNHNSNRPAVVANASASTKAGVSVAIPLPASDPDGNPLTLRVVDQPANGAVGLSGTTATYFPVAGFSGNDTFTFAAWDGSVDSNLGTVTVAVGSAPPTCTLACTATVPATAVQNVGVNFTGSATPSSCSGTPVITWSFGDGSAPASGGAVAHSYAATGSFTWTMTASLNGVTCTRTGSIAISAASACTLACSATVPAGATTGAAIAFQASATPSSCTGTPTYAWKFGDGGGSTQQNPTHSYSGAATFTWAVTAALNGVTCARTGTITITAPVSVPRISGIKKLDEPFRIEIDGSSFAPGVRVFIGTSTTPWPYTTLHGSTQIILSGSTLSNHFPRGARVTVRVVNPDGGSASGSFRR
jgi:PKD repeat protein